MYRQSTEALTKHRLQIIESVKPEGYEAWEHRIQEQVKQNPEAFNTASAMVHELSDKRKFVSASLPQEVDEREEEWDGEPVQEPQQEGIRSQHERRHQAAEVGANDEAGGLQDVKYELEPEPPLSTQQYVAPNY